MCRKCSHDLASRPETPPQGRLPLVGFPAAVCPSRSPVARPGGVTRGGSGRAAAPWARAAAVMDAWVRFSAQSQARERLCRCGRRRSSGGRAEQVPARRRARYGVPKGQLWLRGPARPGRRTL